LFVEFEDEGAIREEDTGVEVVFEAKDGFFEEALHPIGVPRGIEHHGVVLLVHGGGHTTEDEVGLVSVDGGCFLLDVLVESVVEVGDVDLAREVLGENEADEIVVTEEEDFGVGMVEGFAEALCAAGGSIEAAIQLIKVDDGLGSVGEQVGDGKGEIVCGFGIEPIKAQEIASGFAQITGKIALFELKFVLRFDVPIKGAEVLAKDSKEWADDLGGSLGPIFGQFVSDEGKQMVEEVADPKARMCGVEALRPCAIFRGRWKCPRRGCV